MKTKSFLKNILTPVLGLVWTTQICKNNKKDVLLTQLLSVNLLALL